MILDPPSTKVVEKGRTATLVCNASGQPPLTIIWLKDLLPIQPSDRFEFIGINGGKSAVVNNLYSAKVKDSEEKATATAH